MTNAVEAVRRRFAAKRSEEAQARERIEEAAATAATGGRIDDGKVAADLELTNMTEGDFERKVGRYTARAEAAAELGDSPEAELLQRQARDAMLDALHAARFEVAKSLRKVVAAADQYREASKAAQAVAKAEQTILDTLPDPIREAHQRALADATRANAEADAHRHKVRTDSRVTHEFQRLINLAVPALTGGNAERAAPPLSQLTPMLDRLDELGKAPKPGRALTSAAKAADKRLVELRTLTREVRPNPKAVRKIEADAEGGECATPVAMSPMS